MLLIGITGTKGKTTTAWMLKGILEASGIRCGMIGTVGHVVGGQTIYAHHTTPSTKTTGEIFRKCEAAGDRAVIMELTSTALKDGRLKRYKYDAIALLNILPGYHTADVDERREHPDFADYAASKRKCAELVGSGYFAANGDCPISRTAYPGATLFGESPDRYVSGTLLYADRYSTVICLAFQDTGESIVVSFPLIGAHQAVNAMAAATIAHLLGAKLSAIETGLQATKPVPARLEPVADVDGVRVFLDTSMMPDTMRWSLATLREVMGGDGQLSVVFGCESWRAPGNCRAFGRVSGDLADRVYLTSDNPGGKDPRDIAETVRGGMADPGKAAIILDRQEAIWRAVEDAEPNDCVLVSGRGDDLVMRLEAGYATVVSDRAVIRAAARARMATSEAGQQ